ncbi:MAG: hypothetical protein ACTSVI_15435 [Promethearchaeota archaeon]
MFEKYKSIFEDVDKGEIIDLDPWYALFNLSGNPCTVMKSQGYENNKEFFIEQDDFNEVLRYIALAKKGLKKRIVIVGDSGIGKSTFLRFLHLVTKAHSKLKGYLLRFPDPKTFDAVFNFNEDDFEIHDDSFDDDALFNDAEDEDAHPTHLELQSSDFLLIDDCYGSSVEGVFKQFKNVKIIVIALDFGEYNTYIESNSRFKQDRLLVLKSWRVESIIKMLNFTFKTLSVNKQKIITCKDIFDEDALSFLNSSVEGNPSHVLSIICNLMEQMIVMKKKSRVSREKIDFILDKVGVKTYIAIKKGNMKFSSSKFKILSIIKNKKGKANPLFISKRLNITFTMISIHLKSLKALNLVTIKKKGKYRYYDLTIGGKLLESWQFKRHIL